MTDDGKFGSIQMEANFWTGSSNGGSTLIICSSSHSLRNCFFFFTF